MVRYRRLAVDSKDFFIFKNDARKAFLEDNPNFERVHITDRLLFHRMLRFFLKKTRYEMRDEDEHKFI